MRGSRKWTKVCAAGAVGRAGTEGSRSGAGAGLGPAKVGTEPLRGVGPASSVQLRGMGALAQPKCGANIGRGIPRMGEASAGSARSFLEIELDSPKKLREAPSKR